MRKNILILMLAAAASVLLSACSVSPMFHMPCDKKTIRPDEKTAGPLTGTWECREKQEKLTVEFQKEKDGNGFLSLTLTRLENDPGTGAKREKQIPLSGVPVQIGTDTFVCLLLNLNPIQESGSWSGEINFMVRPYFYLAKTEPQKDGSLKIALVSWIRKEKDEKGKTVPTDPSVKLDPDSSLVMNSTEELIRMIQEKKYILTEERIFVRTAGKQ